MPCTGRAAHKGSRGIDLLFLDHGTRRGWGVSVTPGLSLPQGQTRYPVYRWLGRHQGWSGQVRKISPSPAFDPRTFQPVASRYSNYATRPTVYDNGVYILSFITTLNNFKFNESNNSTLCGRYGDRGSTVANPLTPNDPYSGRTAPLTSKRCILYIYSTNIGIEYFKHGIYSPFLSLQNAICFIILTYLVPVLFTFYIQSVLKFKKIIPAPKG